jgi:hypothetical protein
LHLKTLILRKGAYLTKEQLLREVLGTESWCLPAQLEGRIEKIQSGELGRVIKVYGMGREHAGHWIPAVRLLEESGCPWYWELGDTELRFTKPESVIDLATKQGQRMVMDALEFFGPRRGFQGLVVNLQAGGTVSGPPYDTFPGEIFYSSTYRDAILAQVFAFLDTIDPRRKDIILQNVFPANILDRNTGLMHLSPVGYTMSDFGCRPITYDLAHDILTEQTFRAAHGQSTTKQLDTPWGSTAPIYVPPERRFTERHEGGARLLIADLICRTIVRLWDQIRIIDFNGVENGPLAKGCDGADFRTSNVDLYQMVSAVKRLLGLQPAGRNVHVIMEVQEVGDEPDYRYVPRQVRATDDFIDKFLNP